ncbi:hypothetical protein ACJZL1_06255 [Wolbachia endosymbiont of Rhagoletis indifferens]|uniref:hypothetical protein n=1 Tax=Wolbachia endosymbiont of Rhagoletis indifferens TaxID=3383250 RepID=UPI003AF35759
MTVRGGMMVRGSMTITSSSRYVLAAEIPRMNRGMTVRGGMTVRDGMTISSSSRYVLAGSLVSG